MAGLRRAQAGGLAAQMDHAQKQSLPKTPKGPLPDHLDCRDAELVLSLALASAAEVSALYDRIATLERFVLQKTSASPDELRALFDDAEMSKDRADWRRDYVSRLLRGFESALDDDGRAMSREDYRAFMEKLAKRESK